MGERNHAGNTGSAAWGWAVILGTDKKAIQSLAL